MVTERKSLPRRLPASPRKETLEENFERLLAEPVGAPIGKLTKREARYFLTRLAGSDPTSPPGVKVVREIRANWGPRMDTLARKR